MDNTATLIGWAAIYLGLTWLILGALIVSAWLVKRLLVQVFKCYEGARTIEMLVQYKRDQDKQQLLDGLMRLHNRSNHEGRDPT